MDGVTFAKTRHTYGSYYDFWQVVELSGFPVCYVDEIDPYNPHTTYIITPLNGEWQAGWKHASARIVLWDLEWRDKKPDVPGVCDVWASDAWYASKIGAKYVTLGSHPGLCKFPPTDKIYDVVWLAYMVHRRGMVDVQLKERGLRIAPHSEDFEEQRHVLTQSRLMVHVHQHESIPTIPPTRMQTCAAYSLPVLCENVETRYPFSNVVFWAEFRHIADLAQLILGGKYVQELANTQLAFHNLLCERMTFRKCVEGGLNGR